MVRDVDNNRKYKLNNSFILEKQDSMRNLIGSFLMILESVEEFWRWHEKPYDGNIKKWKNCIDVSI